MERNARNKRTETVEDVNAQGEVTETQEKATEGTEGAATGKRAPRPQIDTSGVVVGEPVTDMTLGKRASKLDTDPIAVAVRNAKQSLPGETPNWYPLVLNGKDAASIQSIATRAAAKVPGLGINFDKSKVKSDDTLYFKTGPKRKTNKRKTADTPAEGTAE